MQKIGIIIVNYFNWKDTINCVLSLQSNFNKSSYEYEIAIIDNSCSQEVFFNLTNKLKASIFNYSNNEFVEEKLIKNKISIIESDKNGGFAYGVNIGLKFFLQKENIDYFLLINNDTEVPENTLDKFLKKVESINELGLYTLRINYFEDKNKIWYDGGKFIKWFAKGIHINKDKKILKCKNEPKTVSFATFCFVLIPKELIKKIGLLDTDYFLYYEDLDYSYKVQKKGYKIFHFCSFHIYHKVGASSGGQYSKTWVYYYYRNHIVFIKKNLRNTPYYYSALIYFLLSKFISIPFIALKGIKFLSLMIKGIIDGFKYKS